MRITNRNTSSTKLFIREALSYPLLDNESLNNLFIKLNSFRNVNEEEYNLIKEKIVNSNLRLVISTVNKLCRNSGMDVMDLYQEGTIGLTTAVDKFDSTKGISFSTYATSWINASVIRAINNQSRTIRVPVYVNTIRNKIAKARAELLNSLGRDASVREVSVASGVPELDIIEIDNALASVYSLDRVIGSGENETTFADFVPDSAINPEESVIKQSESEQIESSVYALPSFERKVIAYRYGVGGGEEHSRLQASKEFGCSQETIRLAEIRAIKALRSDKDLMGAIYS